MPREGERSKATKLRTTYAERIVASIRQTLRQHPLTGAGGAPLTDVQLDSAVEARRSQAMGPLAALHEPDLTGGGGGVGGQMTRLGSRSVNSSIGPQWKGGRGDQQRCYDLTAAVLNAEGSGVSPDAKLNVVLEPCRE